jgi:predicted DCC family thiol-disulfide oxidoreductase YuxK
VHRVALLEAARGAGALRFAPLQGLTARQALPVALTARPVTAVLLDARGLAYRSEAILRVWARLPWPWRALAALRGVPRPLRDALYDRVAARRGGLRLGPLEWRGSLPPALQARFLP